VLFGYPEAGFQNNWLHEVLIEMIGADMDRIESGEPLIVWPECIPQARRDVLKGRNGLKDRRKIMLEAYQALAPDMRRRVRSAMVRQNEIPAIFADDLPCDRLQDLPDAFRDAVRKFFDFSFHLLAELGLRDENYHKIYQDENFRDKVCAFCGIEILDAPGQKREALDHYLSISRYPFAGANFRNLIPMGTKCNSRYKGQQDIIIDTASGNRRSCCDPYTSPSIELSLLKSRPFEGTALDLSICPQWVIEWEGGDPVKLQTWETVFAISERYRESSLNPNFRSWIDHFREWAARRPGTLNTAEQIKQALFDFAQTVVPQGYSESAFLKRATMQMLAHRCDDPNVGERLVSWLVYLVQDFPNANPLAV
jgi:hypothetical protein